MPFNFSNLTKAHDELVSSVTKAHDTVVSTIAKAPERLPTKGIRVYTYISAPAALEISLSVPGRAAVVHRDQHVFRSEALQIEAAAIKYPLKRTGRFELVVRVKDGRELTRQWLDVDPVTGFVDGSSSMDDLLGETRSIVDRDLAVCFGLYRAGPGQVGLPNEHQVYVVATQNWSAWQGGVAPRGSKQADKPFSHMVLPAPHDVGMNTMATVDAILAHAGPAGAAAIIDVLPGFKAATPVLEALVGGASKLAAATRIAPDIVASLAITQKDSIAHLCSIGARYFEFRPAHCHARIMPHLPFDDDLFFQHGPIPGMAYANFLRDIVTFLKGHRDEIVVVHVRWDGVPDECKRPDGAELKRYLDAALAPAEGKIHAGSLSDLRSASIKTLREQGKRLLMVVDAPDVLSTYDDAANATLDGVPILAAFDRVLRAPGQEHSCLTVAQCQATPTNMADVLKYSVATADASTMLLMATKARCGHLMLPWLRQNVPGRCRRDRLLVLMDDFLDGSVADVAVAVTKERLA